MNVNSRNVYFLRDEDIGIIFCGVKKRGKYDHIDDIIAAKSPLEKTHTQL